MIFTTFIAVFALEKLPQQEFSRGIGATPTRGSPWPVPQKMTTSKTQFLIDEENFVFNWKPSPTQTPPCDIIQAAFSRYRKIIFGPLVDALKFRSYKRPTLTGSVVSDLSVTFDGTCSGYPSLESDESC